MVIDTNPFYRMCECPKCVAVNKKAKAKHEKEIDRNIERSKNVFLYRWHHRGIIFSIYSGLYERFYLPYWRKK